MYIPSFPTYLSVYILTKSEFISSCIRPAVGLNIVQITNFFVNVLIFFKWPPVAILDVHKSLLTISDQYHNFYFCEFVTKWLPAAILEVQNSLSMAFLAISDQYETFFSKHFYNTLDGRNSLLNAFLAISDRYARI